MPRDSSVAILGATGHIAKNLAWQFGRAPGNDVTLFTRDPARAGEFVALNGPFLSPLSVRENSSFGERSFGTVVNCVGIGNRADSDMTAVFDLTERTDRLVLDYQARHPGTLAVHLSSGAVYGDGLGGSAPDSPSAVFPVNGSLGPHLYGIAKLNSEAKHRGRPDLSIVDLRIFGFFSRFVDLDERYFMSDVARTLLAGGTLRTSPDDFVRDYVHPADLARLVDLCRGRTGPLNAAFDVYSAKPVSKKELLAEFAGRYGLHWVPDASAGAAATGAKPSYFSSSRNAARIGYEPARTSLETLREETDALLENRGRRQAQGDGS